MRAARPKGGRGYWMVVPKRDGAAPLIGAVWFLILCFGRLGPQLMRNIRAFFSGEETTKP